MSRVKYPSCICSLLVTPQGLFFIILCTANLSVTQQKSGFQQYQALSEHPGKCSKMVVKSGPPNLQNAFGRVPQNFKLIKGHEKGPSSEIRDPHLVELQTQHQTSFGYFVSQDFAEPGKVDFLSLAWDPLHGS